MACAVMNIQIFSIRAGPLKQRLSLSPGRPGETAQSAHQLFSLLSTPLDVTLQINLLSPFPMLFFQCIGRRLETSSGPCGCT
jgi:hypothetical protein